MPRQIIIKNQFKFKPCSNMVPYSWLSGEVYFFINLFIFLRMQTLKAKYFQEKLKGKSNLQ